MTFAKAFVINLKFNTDRLSLFQSRTPKCLGDVVVWEAVHGDSVRHPSWWTAGAGAWGCYRSHLQILEYCYQRNIANYVVFEDDVLFAEGFDNEIASVMESIPDDWGMLYLGGQLLHETVHPPLKMSDTVYRPWNVNRTHAFAVNKSAYEAVYKHLNETPFEQGFHIDHHLGRLHESGTVNVYCPARWLCGQDSGPSNISGSNNSAQWWIDAEKLADADHKWAQRHVPSVFLEAPLDVAIELERRGWHRGHWQNADHLDIGICNALSSLDVKESLHQWHRTVMPEAVREGSKCVCLYHPTLHLACVRSLHFIEFTHIIAESADDAERQLRETLPSSSSSMEKPRRNLIYHIWPKREGGTWKWNVEQLLKRIEQFDGVRSIGVATSADSCSLVDVQTAFDGVRIDNWIECENDHLLGEAATFRKLLETVPRDSSITFRGHAKGVKYDDPMQMREWAEMLYEICLDDSEHVDAMLNQYPACGPFMVDNRWPGGNKYGWFYSGGFYWFRSDVFNSDSWSNIRQDYWGAELWIGEHFDRSGVGILFGQNCGHLYEPSELARMKQWLSEWKEQKRK